MLCLAKPKGFSGSSKEERGRNVGTAYAARDFPARALPGIPVAALVLCQVVSGADTLCSTGTALQLDTVNCTTVSSSHRNEGL